MENPLPQKSSGFPRISVVSVLYVVSFLVIGRYILLGWTYYATPIGERPRHAEYVALKPGGMTGHGLGVVGGAFILLTFAYSARKRWKPLKKAGPIPRWLEIHIFFGITGPLLIVLHTGLKLNGLVAVAFWSMVAVVASGFVGRFLMRLIPRDIKGRVIDIQELRKLKDSMRLQLLGNGAMTESDLADMEQMAVQAGSRSAEPFTYLVALAVNDMTVRARIRRIVKQASAAGTQPLLHGNALRRIAYEEAVLNRRIHLLKKSQDFFRNWHRIHKPFTYILLVIMLVHVAVSVYLGYRWIF